MNQDWAIVAIAEAWLIYKLTALGLQHQRAKAKAAKEAKTS